MHWSNYPCKNDWWRTSPSAWKFGAYWFTRLQKADFRFYFAHNASAVTPSEKGSVNTNKKSITRFPINPNEHHTLSLSTPKKGSKTQCPQFEQYVAITPKRYEISCQLLLITNRKSHKGFLLIPTSMTLNDLERRNSLYFAFFLPNSIALLANYVTVVKDRPIMFVKYCLPVPVFHFWP